MKIEAVVIALALTVSASVPRPSTGVEPPPEQPAQLFDAIQQARPGLPFGFVENRGQWPTEAKFVARKGPVTAALDQDGLILRYGEGSPLRLLFEGASPLVTVVGERVRAAHYNYMRGNDSQHWRLRVPSYASVLYRSLYPGVGLRVREEDGRLEYDVLLEPNARLAEVVFRVDGAANLEVAGDGALLLHTEAGTLRQTPPRTWEVLPDGEQRMLAARFRIIDARRYGFVVPQRDETLALVIDPGLDWSSYLGGGLEDFVNGVDVARDGTGDILVTGVTTSTDFPAATVGPGAGSVYVARFSAAGNELRYVTYLSGSAGAGNTYVGRLAADANGGVAVIGYTSDATFPVTPGAYQNTIHGGSDVFLARLNGAGALTAATFIGGTDDEAGAFTSRGVAFDASGAPIIAGVTLSPDFPTTLGAYDRTFNPTNEFTTDTFIARFSPGLNQLTYSTFFSAGTWIKELVVDPQGYVTIAGETGGALPTTSGALDRIFNNGVSGVEGEDGFVSRLKLDGAGGADLKYSTYLGGHNRDEAWGLAFDPGNPELVTVAGWTWQDFFARDFPTTPGSHRPNPLPLTSTTPADPYVQEGFVTRLRFPAAGGGSLVWSTFIGGSLWEHATDVAVGAGGEALVLGGTRAHDFPTTRGAFDRTLGGVAGLPYDCFISRLSSDGSQLLYSTLLGGSGTECEQPALNDESHIVHLGGNSVMVVGETKSSDFPSTPGAFDATYAPGPAGFAATRDVFVSRLTLTADASGDLSVGTPTLLSPANGATFPITGNVELQWSAVADPSGIEAYNYQVSSRSDFPANFISHRGSVSEPRLLLPATATITWYWRIQAADRAGNLGEWSSPSSFTMGAAGAQPALAFVRLDPSRVTGGGTSGGTLFLNFGAVAPPGGSVVTLASSNPSVASVPGSVTIPAGANSAAFSISSSAVTATTQVAITGRLGLTQTSTLTVEPPAVVLLSAVTLSPASVTGGTPSTGTVTLSGPAPAGGANVVLTSNNPAVAAVPGSVSVAAGQTSATFAVTTAAVAAPTSVNISAGYGTSLLATLTVNPSAAPPVTLSQLTLNPTSVVGGASSTGTVTLSAAAPAGGAVVTLSDNSSAASVPGSVTVAAGSTSASFAVTTSTVSATTTVTITGSRNGVSRTATLTVTAGSGGTPAAPTLLSPASNATPAQPVSFDWTDVANAASYEIQVDSSSTISSPFVASATVTTSQATLGTLPAQRLWWRVRARNSAGTAGPFSSTRRFTPQALSGPATLSAVSVSPTSVVGGAGATGTVTLTGAAPTGGALATLTSSNAAANVPGSVSVAAGATTATFTITTSSVSSATSATISAVLGGVTRTAQLTVNPAGANATLTVTATGRSGERITSTPTGINVSVGSTGSASFPVGTAITLRVTNGREAVWSGACSSGGNERQTCTFTLTGNAAVTADVD